jgi:hypothetical protein
MVADGARFTTRFIGLLAILARHGIVNKGCYRREGISCGRLNLIELNGDDLRRDPLNVRKATLASVLARAASGLRLNEHMMPASSVSRAQTGYAE